VVGHRSLHGCSCCHRPAQRLDDAPRCDVLGATVHDVELLAVLIITGVRVEVAIDGPKCPLGILELHLLLLVALKGNLLPAFPLPVRHAIVAWLLLLLLAELLRELLDLPALLRVVAPGVVYRALQTTLITTGVLPRPLVAMWAMSPTSRSSSYDSRSSSQRLVVVANDLLLSVSIFAAPLSSDIYFGQAGLPYLWGRL
jgi:hypothetical protein